MNETELRSVERWAENQLGDLTHERRVMRIAAKLFGLTSDFHGLDRHYCDVLRGAALVHDVGRCIGKPDHPVIGAKMLLKENALRLRDEMRRALAFITLYHRDEVPDHGEEDILADGDDRHGLRKVLALLRTADALDGRSLESPKLVFELRKHRLHVGCYLEGLEGKAARVYSRRRKHRLMEEELGCRVQVEVRAGVAV